jgi:prepilin-type N-terminal cleavage/methylation domain-containing protein
VRKSGFSVIEVVVVIAIVGIVTTLGVVGYNRWKQTETAKKTTTDTSQQSAPASAPAINKTSDLDTATTTVDKADLGDTDSSELDTLGNSF